VQLGLSLIVASGICMSVKAGIIWSTEVLFLLYVLAFYTLYMIFISIPRFPANSLDFLVYL
jgi:hypothetical protein